MTAGVKIMCALLSALRDVGSEKEQTPLRELRWRLFVDSVISGHPGVKMKVEGCGDGLVSKTLDKQA